MYLIFCCQFGVQHIILFQARLQADFFLAKNAPERILNVFLAQKHPCNVFRSSINIQLLKHNVFCKKYQILKILENYACRGIYVCERDSLVGLVGEQNPAVNHKSSCVRPYLHDPLRCLLGNILIFPSLYSGFTFYFRPFRRQVFLVNIFPSESSDFLLKSFKKH